MATTRSVFEHRAAVVGADREAMQLSLVQLAAGEPGPDTVTGRARAAGKTVWLFPGQGSQRLGMGAALYRRFPLFARAFDEAAQALDEHLRLPLRQVLWGDDAKLLDGTEFAQPALFAVEVALAALWQSWGVLPDVVMGHSVGEIAAAHVAGVLSLADAARLVAARGRLMGALPAGGVMVAVAAGEAELAPLLTEGVSVAAVNGPGAVVISGEQAAVNAVADRLASQGRRIHRLAVSHAFHSSLMEPMIEPFAQVVGEMSPAEPRVALISNVTGQLAGAGYGSPDYWVEHVRAPARSGGDGLEGDRRRVHAAGRHELTADDLRGVDLPVADRLEQHLDRHAGLEPGHGVPEAVVNAVAERPVVLHVAIEVEHVGVRVDGLVVVGRAVQEQHLVAGRDRDVGDRDVAGGRACETLHR